MPLHNRISRQELKDRIKQDSTPRTTISFYSYFKIDDPQAFRNDLYRQLRELDVLGRINLAHEGINAQVSVPSANFNDFRSFLYSVEPMNGLRLNVAV